VNSLVNDTSKTIAVFVNDFDQEFADALVKLSERLGRELQGVVLVDDAVKAGGRNTPDEHGVFKQIVCDFSDDTALRKAVKSFEDNLLLVTTSSDRNQPYLQRLLPFVPYTLGPTETSLTWATHKHMMRRFTELYEPSLVPKYQMIESASSTELAKVTSRLSFPVIIKPTGLAASLLVAKADHPQDLERIASKSFEVLRQIYHRDNGRGRPAMIVEEYIEGDMYTVDAYVNDSGRVWTLPFLRARTGHSVGLEGFYEFQADSYHELTENQQALGRQAAADVIHALSLRSCVAHIEMFHTAKGWKIIELGPRAGGQRQDIYLASYGIDHALNELLLKIGLEPDVEAEHTAYSTTVYLYPEVEGTIEAVEGIEEARANRSIYNLNVHAHPGQVALYSQNGGKWLIRGLLANPDRDQLYRDAETVRSLIKISTTPQEVRS
jgi:biotin carboxylase